MSLLNASHHPALSTSPDTTVADACARMLERNVGSIVVVNDKDQPIGILTEREALRLIVGKNIDAANTRLGDVMTTPCMVIPSDRSIHDALSVMLNKTIFHMAVIDADRKLAGVVSYRTLLRQHIDNLNAEVDGLTAYMGVDGIGGD